MRRIVPKPMRPKSMRKKWSELQKFCARKETWKEAVLAADKLLDQALKRKRCSGKSMGERLVSAQNLLSDNDSVWYSHNLAKKIVENTEMKLRQYEVKKSLLGFGQALKDLGALRDAKE